MGFCLRVCVCVFYSFVIYFIKKTIIIKLFMFILD